jgi:hypothetical protein
MAMLVLSLDWSSERSRRACESRAEGERRQAGDDYPTDANSAVQSGAGFLPSPLLCESKGGEKSPHGDPAGSTQQFTHGGFASEHLTRFMLEIDEDFSGSAPRHGHTVA